LEFGDVIFQDGGKAGVPGEKPLKQLGDNQTQTQPTYGTGLELNLAILAGGKHSHPCTIPAPQQQPT